MTHIVKTTILDLYNLADSITDSPSKQLSFLEYMVNIEIFLEIYSMLFISFDKCGIIDHNLIHAYAYNFNSKHSKCTDTYEKINGADLYGMLHFLIFTLLGRTLRPRNIFYKGE